MHLRTHHQIPGGPCRQLPTIHPGFLRQAGGGSAMPAMVGLQRFPMVPTSQFPECSITPKMEYERCLKMEVSPPWKKRRFRLWKRWIFAGSNMLDFRSFVAIFFFLFVTGSFESRLEMASFRFGDDGQSARGVQVQSAGGIQDGEVMIFIEVQP